MPQEFAQANRQGRTDGQAAGEDLQSMAAQAAQQSDVEFDALDAVLDDIESTLETNAEEYVNSFVQKGGE
ncbi:ubiquitin-like protein Pup [Bifidobacterium stellenboschense]|uniref:Prokaryotic ubiquitin-like protein Pup n=1 Tax=Bifidobacterium stellenboschense TaxID=762211 RepID=A0A087DTC2_9BIFI|nr:ubiquitin-like protein Pup [Bifidobacterium stellenboschense]KFI98772.1 ubiquitin [Bifidobacterium stellenboschense]